MNCMCLSFDSFSRSSSAFATIQRCLGRFMNRNSGSLMDGCMVGRLRQLAGRMEATPAGWTNNTHEIQGLEDIPFDSTSGYPMFRLF